MTTRPKKNPGPRTLCLVLTALLALNAAPVHAQKHGGGGSSGGHESGDSGCSDCGGDEGGSSGEHGGGHSGGGKKGPHGGAYIGHAGRSQSLHDVFKRLDSGSDESHHSKE